MSENLIGATTAVFPIRLSVAVASPVDVEWATRDGSAVAGSDYKATAGTVTFLPGETEKQIEVQVYGQAITPSDDKVFFIRLNPPSNAVLVDAIITCTINIIDDQGIPSVAVVVAEGRRGPKGDPGLSAYEQAVLMGYTGTLTEWMDQIADASKAADRAGDHAVSASEDALKAQEDALKAQNAAKNAVFAGVVFPTAAEGVDPVLGVQNGAYFNVRSPLSEHYIDEYQNVNGVAVATGKSYPTSDHFQEISEHTALPFVTGTLYKLNQRVVLTNGDIVKSTIPNNTNDPNVDMTGWINPQAEQKAINAVTMKYVVSTDELLAIENPATGWTYRVLETGTTYQFDPSQVAINNGGTILNGWVAIGLKYVTPEMFGADPTGATSSRIAIKRMIDSLSEGGVIECKPNAIYYNDCPNGAADEWRILQNNVYILAHGATFKRRATSLATESIDVNMAALRVDGDNVTIEGKVRFDGSEAYADIVNTSGVSIATGEYVRGYASSHGLFLNRANNFTALDIDSRDAVFNVYASLCDNLNIKGYCKSSGQVYPLVGGDLQLGSGIKTANCTNINIDLITDYAGYAGCEIEPSCKVGHVKSIARNPSFYGIIFQNGCEDLTFESVATGASNGSPLRIGQGGKRIVGTYTGSGCKYGLLLEPSSSDNTPEGDITQCDVRGVSHNCVNRGVLLVNWAIGGAVRESSIHHRSNNDGGGTQPAFTIENAVNCSFDLGVNTAKGALVVNRVYESEIHMAYMKNITDANPMYFTAGNTVDLTCRYGGVTYVLKQTNGLLFGSSLNASAAALPVVPLTAFDIRASQIVTPSLPTVNSSTITNGLWVDTANSSQVKRKV